MQVLLVEGLANDEQMHAIASRYVSKVTDIERSYAAKLAQAVDVSKHVIRRSAMKFVNSWDSAVKLSPPCGPEVIPCQRDADQSIFSKMLGIWLDE